ncbi:hypothetical protein DUF2235 [Octadecabacter antarcticus 307]|uniref:T6SS Phospholipase effector Tle1-like catalytic domain-containing protein n=1 Tax=Octadecabacter antarcticus 307 TaxID=391626 RepID=M9R565_9RHOB|nr:DUF2235 domain-containing protein [Octadecabacter antarcticus]AGI67794.1 hypothetical protein DUF2235 [Octadecabacter antarcticus 307]
MKRIAIFIDGTRNRPDAEHPTNVVRLAQSVRHRALGGSPAQGALDSGMPQIVLYSTGVGSGQGNTALARNTDKIFGGALGWGLTSIIVNAYRELMFVYEPGDEVMVFGFSRGAFAARSLVGLIRNCGILERDSLRFVPDAIDRYRSMKEADGPDSDESHEFRLKHSPQIMTNDKEVKWRKAQGLSVVGVVPFKIAYMGVWDTVSAMGAPEILPVAKWLNVQYRFHDTRLTSMVLAARHAIAIDERRKLYPSTPWTNSLDLNEKHAKEFKPTHLQQWFPGNHGSVGGGGPQTGLSSISLNWIALGAHNAGLEIDFDEMDKHADTYDVTVELHNMPIKAGIGTWVSSRLSGDRGGPDDLNDVSMSAVDRGFEVPEYLATQTLSNVRQALGHIDDVQRDKMRIAYRWVNGGDTHMPGNKKRPRGPHAR